MSLNSKRLFDVLHNKQTIYQTIRSNTELFDAYMFDNYEVLNAIFFKEGSVSMQGKNISNIVDQIEENFIEREHILRFTDHKHELRKCLLAVNQEYYENVIFERHCKNQIFSNLQPKLRAQGILSNKSPMLEILVPFLLAEIALYLHVYNTDKYTMIYGLEKEMDILTAIQNIKYKTFAPFLKNNTPYHQIQLDSDANA